MKIEEVSTIRTFQVELNADDLQVLIKEGKYLSSTFSGDLTSHCPKLAKLLNGLTDRRWADYLPTM